MSKQTRITFTSVASLLLALTVVYASTSYGKEAEGDIVEFRGLKVDFHLASAAQRETVIRSLEHQIEVAMSITAPASVLEFFRTVTVVIDPALLSEQTSGQYMQNDSPPFIRMKPIELPKERPILLHELMHAYHHQVLKQPTPDVEGAYRRALQAKIYPDEYLKTAFLYDSREYFANVATIFLLGKIERPPYNCAIIRKAQPKFVAYLASVFGEHDCNVE